jgi:hypothetical protein
MCFAEDGKAGVAGEMILSLNVNAEGKVASHQPGFLYRGE